MPKGRVHGHLPTPRCNVKKAIGARDVLIDLTGARQERGCERRLAPAHDSKPNLTRERIEVVDALYSAIGRCGRPYKGITRRISVHEPASANLVVEQSPVRRGVAMSQRRAYDIH
jgi:hypothetical protein